jgi:AraC-like DNA-binding protein
VKNQLIQLMEEEKIYINNEITLKSLSESLKITSHQLSQLLNDEMNVNFRTFINSYRIKDAKKALLEYPEKSVLQIAFSVGFNTKSVFNTYFSKECGESPTEYRKNRLKSQ